MADLVPCTGRSEAPAARTWGRAFVFIPAVFCGSCRAGGGRAAWSAAGRDAAKTPGDALPVPRALALPDSGKKRCVMLERSQGGARVWAAYGMR